MACGVAADERPAIPTVPELRALDKAPAVCPVQEPPAPWKSPAVCTVRELRAGDAPSAMGRPPDLYASDTEHAAHDRVDQIPVADIVDLMNTMKAGSATAGIPTGSRPAPSGERRQVGGPVLGPYRRRRG
ncbi:uncharacterized protein [Triticum aestivum]|uniref:uncharacterized protein isoform X2 n=1 Tax=Triticum aestivum TaxID=4565 RepID=UPI001D0260B7|nr:uncharacterized protein LOC123044117 isoform X2 [Triticum aestivum]